jgi:hypothetical protein
MTWISRRVLVSLVGAAALSSTLVACSGSSTSGAVGTSGQAEAVIAIDTSSAPIITVRNLTDQPLIDVNISIKSGILAFTDRVSRLEANEQRPIQQSDFTSPDGTSFNLQVARPSQIAVTAHNLDGKQFELTVPWK